MKCDYCGKEVKDDDLEELVADGETMNACSECKDGLEKCDDCGEWARWGTHDVYHDRHKRQVCDSCFNENYRECEDCGNYFHVDNINYIENIDRSICDECHNNYAMCDGCGGTFHVEDMRGNYCDNCHSDDHEDGNYPSHWKIQKTSEDVAGTPIFGVELEVGFKGDDFCEDDMMLYDWVSYTRDGSINYLYNMEFLIHPMSWSWIKKNYEQIECLLNKIKSCGGKVDSSCGIHIHVNRDSFKDFSHLYRFFKFIHGNEEYFFDHSGRKHCDDINRWASFSPSEVDNCDSRTDLINLGKYRAVNLVHNVTVEIRIFAATLTFSKYIENIRLIRDVFNYTADDNCDMDINNFATYHADSDTVKQLALQVEE